MREISEPPYKQGEQCIFLAGRWSQIVLTGSAVYKTEMTNCKKRESNFVSHHCCLGGSKRCKKEHWSSPHHITLVAPWKHLGSTLKAPWKHLGSTLKALWKHLGSTVWAEAVSVVRSKKEHWSSGVPTISAARLCPWATTFPRISYTYYALHTHSSEQDILSIWVSAYIW